MGLGAAPGACLQAVHAQLLGVGGVSHTSRHRRHTHSGLCHQERAPALQELVLGANPAAASSCCQQSDGFLAVPYGRIEVDRCSLPVDKPG
jgi:hypothetical protein